MERAELGEYWILISSCNSTINQVEAVQRPELLEPWLIVKWAAQFSRVRLYRLDSSFCHQMHKVSWLPLHLLERIFIFLHNFTARFHRNAGQPWQFSGSLLSRCIRASAPKFAKVGQVNQKVFNSLHHYGGSIISHQKKSQLGCAPYWLHCNLLKCMNKCINYFH